MSWFEEVMLTVLVGLSPIWAALGIGAICWAARHVGEPTGTKETERRILRCAQNDRWERGGRILRSAQNDKTERRHHEARRV